MEEIIDIVNESDDVVGTAEKEEAHDRKLLHRVVDVWIVNNKKHILLQKRSPTRKRGANKWDASVGGHIGTGESYEHAAAREMKEELGAELPIKYVGNYRETSHEVNHMGWVFVAHGNGPFTFDPVEASEVRWFDAHELKKLISIHSDWFTPGSITSLKLLFAKL